MKRSILVMMVCLIAVFNVAGQGINFFKGNYQEQPRRIKWFLLIFIPSGAVLVK